MNRMVVAKRTLAITGAPPYWKRGALCGHLVLNRFGIEVFGGRAGSVFELRDRAGPHFGRATLGFARHIFAALELAFDFDVCTLGERPGRFCQAAKGDYTVPIGARDELARPRSRRGSL